MWRRALAATAVLSTLGGCASVDYRTLPAGAFSGSVIVMWLGEGGASGGGRFLFVPDRNRPLTFARRDSHAPAAIIVPDIMYTDGGSIPKIAQLFRGFSPWGYAPAYMIHDWLFTARHCLTDKDPDPRYAAVAKVDFDESAKILGEAIHALIEAKTVRDNDIAGASITAAVDGVIARRNWNAEGACAQERVTPEHRAMAQAAFEPSQQPALRGFSSRRSAPPSAKPAKVITRITF